MAKTYTFDEWQFGLFSLAQIICLISFFISFLGLLAIQNSQMLVSLHTQLLTDFRVWITHAVRDGIARYQVTSGAYLFEWKKHGAHRNLSETQTVTARKSLLRTQRCKDDHKTSNEVKNGVIKIYLQIAADDNWIRLAGKFVHIINTNDVNLVIDINTLHIFAVPLDDIDKIIDSSILTE